MAVTRKTSSSVVSPAAALARPSSRMVFIPSARAAPLILNSPALVKTSSLICDEKIRIYVMPTRPLYPV